MDEITIGEEEDLPTSQQILTSPHMRALRADLLQSGALEGYSQWLKNNRPTGPYDSAALLFAATQFAVDILGIAGALLMADDDEARIQTGSDGIVEYITAALPGEIKLQKSIINAIVGVLHEGEEDLDIIGGNTVSPVDTDTN